MSDWQALCSDLEQEAASLFRRYFVEGVLRREVFALAKPYLWDFLVGLFWEAHGLAKLKRAEQEQLKRWLSTDRCGALDLAAGRFYCDRDGLALVPSLPAALVGGRDGETLEWGPWQFVLSGLAPGATFQLRICGPLPKRYKEKLRRDGVPLRFRELLPQVVVGDRIFFAYELLFPGAATRPHLRCVRGPDPRRFRLDKAHFSPCKTGNPAVDSLE